MKSAGSRFLVGAAVTGAALLMTPTPALAGGQATTCTADAQLAGAQTYVAALIDPSLAYEVPLAQNVIRDVRLR